MTKPKLPPPLTAKDAFESTEEYTKRRITYESAAKTDATENARAVEKLQNEENLKKVQAKVVYVEQGIKVSAPFIERLKTLQARQFILPGEQVTIELGAPDADKSCFPSTIKYKEKTWSVNWKYTDRNKARDLYSTRTFLKAEALVQLDEAKKEGYMMTAARITHPGTGEQSVLSVAEVQTFIVVKEFNEINSKVLEEVKKKLITAKIIAEYGQEYFSATSGLGFSKNDPIVCDFNTGLIWTQDASSAKMSWSEAISWISDMNVNGYLGGFKDWRLPTKDELKSLAKFGGSHPAASFNLSGFSGVKDDGYWSSTTKSDFIAWYVDMRNGGEDYYAKTYRGYYVWPVRGGQQVE